MLKRFSPARAFSRCVLTQTSKPLASWIERNHVSCIHSVSSVPRTHATLAHTFHTRRYSTNTRDEVTDPHVKHENNLPLSSIEEDVPPEPLPPSDKLPSWLNQLRVQDVARMWKQYELEWLPDDEIETTKFEFDPEIWDHTEIDDTDKIKLSVGRDKTFTRVAQSYMFPDYQQNPSRYEPIYPSYLWIDPAAEQEKILFQLSKDFPPLLWIPFKPQIDVLKRLYEEIIEVESSAVAKNIYVWEKMQMKLEEKLGTKKAEEQDPEKMRDEILKILSEQDPKEAQDEYKNTCHLYVGNVESLELIEKSFLNNPFVFNLPIVYGSRNVHLRNSQVKYSKFRTIYSRSIITLEARNDMLLELSEGETPMVPIFAHINYPDAPRLSGPVPKRYNKLFDSDFPNDIPVDVIAALLGFMNKGYPSLRKEMEELEGSDNPETVSPISIAHLAFVRDPDFDKIFQRFHQSKNPYVRIACLKGAAELGLKKEVQEMLKIEQDPEVLDMIKKVIERW